MPDQPVELLTGAVDPDQLQLEAAGEIHAKRQRAGMAANRTITVRQGRQPSGAIREDTALRPPGQMPAPPPAIERPLWQSGEPL